MKVILFVAILNFIGTSQNFTNKKVPVMDFNQFEPFLHYSNDTTYLVNFWATWCAPCRDEIPAIEKVREKYKSRKFKIFMVSLDFPTQLESRLIPFIKSNNIKSEVILLDDPNQNVWIDKVDPSWSGEIPYTIIYGKDFRIKYSKSFSFNELDSIINLKLN
jgi:thiol-disulfide isomerase/thioredoxin